MSDFAVILPAAGRSTRFGSAGPHQKKVFQELRSRAVWLRSVEAFINRSDVAQVIVVVSRDDEDWFRDKFRPNLAFMNLDLVTGGRERADSVENALAVVRPEVRFVAVHDAARPIIAQAWIDEVFAAARQDGGAIPGTPISSTIKRVKDSAVVETVPRDGLYAAQTPQVFRREILVDAYARRDGLNGTDEAQLVERLGYRVTVVEGSPLNIKITTREDLRLADSFLDLLPKETGLKTPQTAVDKPFDSFK